MEPSVPVTLRLAATIAAALYRLRALLLVGAAAALIWLVLVIVEPERTSTSALLPLTLLLWAALALCMAYTLPRLPPAIAPGDGLKLRLSKRLRQAAYGLAFFAMLLVGGFILYLSWRAVPLIVE